MDASRKYAFMAFEESQIRSDRRLPRENDSSRGISTAEVVALVPTIRPAELRSVSVVCGADDDDLPQGRTLVAVMAQDKRQFTMNASQPWICVPPFRSAMGGASPIRCYCVGQRFRCIFPFFIGRIIKLPQFENSNRN